MRFIDTVSPHLFLRYSDFAEVVFSTVCYIGWGIMPHPARRQALVRKPANEAYEIAPLGRLDTMNDMFSRVGRRELLCSADRGLRLAIGAGTS